MAAAADCRDTRVGAQFSTPVDSAPVDVATADSKLLNFTLAVKPIEERVEVNSDQPEALSIERTENADQIAISGKQLDALPDDPDDLQADLLALAGPAIGPDGPQIIVDGFKIGRAHV